MAHINPAEAKLLNDVTDGGSINPDTGLPEFFFGDFFSGLSDSFSSIGTSMSDSFSSIGDSMSSFGDSFSSGLSDIGNSVSSNLDSSFGKGFSDQVGNFAGGVASRMAGDYVSNKIGKKVGGPLGDLLGSTIGGAVGNTLGDTVSGAFKPTETVGAGLTDNLKPTKATQSNTASLSAPTQARSALSTPKPARTEQNLGVVGNGLGMQSHGLGMSSHGLGMGEKPQPKPRPAQPKPEPMPSLKGLNIPQPAQPKPVNQERLKSVIADFKAKQQQGGIQNLLQNGPTQNANAKPFGTAPALTPEASASNARLAAASAKTTDHSLLKRDVTDALKTGGAQARAEVQDLAQQMDQLQPGTGTKLAQEVGLKLQNHPDFPPRKPDLVKSPPISVNELNKILNGEPQMFKTHDGTVRQAHPPQFESPTESGEIRPGDTKAKQGGAWNVRRTDSKTNMNYPHKGTDFVAKPGEDIKSSVTGTVVNVKASPYTDGKFTIVDIETPDGYTVRHFYVSPSLEKGARVKAGKTIIGQAQHIAKGKKGMTNHVHVEIRDPRIKAYDKPGLRGFKDIKPNLQSQ